MIDRCDVVVVGSGGLGAATAFNLAKRGVLNVALIDKHDIGWAGTRLQSGEHRRGPPVSLIRSASSTEMQ